MADRVKITRQQYENLKEWAYTLTSTEHEQVTGRLKETISISDSGDRKVGYCCLGIAAETFGVPNAQSSWAVNKTGHKGCFTFAFPLGYAEGFPNPDWMMETFGMPESAWRMLSTANDNGVSFEVIGRMVNEFADLAKADV